MQRISTKPFAAAVAGAAMMLAGATAQAAPLGAATSQGIAAETGGPAVTKVQYYRYGHRRGYYRGYGHRGYGYRRHNDDAAAAIAGGIIGLAAGAIIAGSAQGGPRTVDYCMRRFRSYDPGSGTYLGYDGLRHPCP